MNSTLDQIEARLQALIENNMERLPWGGPQHQLAHQFIEAIRVYQLNPTAHHLLPNLFSIFLSPDVYARWQAVPHLFDQLALALEQAAAELEDSFSAPPAIRLISHPELGDTAVHIEATWLSASDDSDALHETAALPKINSFAAGGERALPQAYIVLSDNRVIPLHEAVINLGRRSDNHIVINDPRVSRAHAQIRSIREHYVIFDLNSTGGTYVNGQNVRQCTLKPGDVISLAGVSLIYGEDLPPQEEDASERTRTLGPRPHAPEGHS